jgi:peroxiredoxin Q/BCP
MAKELAAGMKAPAFALAAAGGATVTLADLAKSAVVVYFYPKDDTPGCTVEACEFGKSHKAFVKGGAVVLGISPDGVESHARFAEKFGLPFTLLSDPEHATAEAYGVWVKKSMYGKEYMGIERSTFLVAPGGAIARIWRKVKAEGHAAEVLAAIGEL